jgi:translation initiation factor 1 (eIF-1/SUI1)
MPKQRVDVNENLNISIGELLKSNLSEPGDNPETNENTEQSSKIASREKMTGDSSNSPDKEKNSNINTPRADIRKMIPQIGKISLQRQRAGRGGRTVTLISIVEAKSEVKQNLEALLKELKKSLGCGGQIEEGKIVLHGEIVDRASEWFIKMGAKAVKS